jgi:L-ascorbate metabolism protein UlaG (beta-lactamase superfamily)
VRPLGLATPGADGARGAHRSEALRGFGWVGDLGRPGRGDDPAVSLRWLGVAGFAIADADGVILHGPYMSRPGLFEVIFSGYRPDPDFARDLVVALRPRIVMPHHFDSFFTALDDPEAGAPSDPEDLAAFEDEMRRTAAAAGVDVEVRRLELFESLAVAPSVWKGSRP